MNRPTKACQSRHNRSLRTRGVSGEMCDRCGLAMVCHYTGAGRGRLRSCTAARKRYDEMNRALAACYR